MTISPMISMVPAERIELPTFGLQNRTRYPSIALLCAYKCIDLLTFSRFSHIGKDGKSGREPRSRQPQNQDHLFASRSRGGRA